MPLLLGLACWLMVSAFACTEETTQTGSDAAAEVPVRLTIADSATAAREILDDDLQGFFDRITLIDMAIQMKQPIGLGETRADRLPQYRAYLATDVTDFAEAEARQIEKVTRQALADIARYLSPRALPDELILVKTKGNHYGAGVWYTREECIVIPADALARGEEEELYTVMLHEIFHVWSRYHQPQRDSLYAMIGFESWGDKALDLPEPLARQLLLNPDGLDASYYITLQDDNGMPLPAMPFIYTRSKNFSPGKPDFFSYLSFDLFPAIDAGERVVVRANEDGTSPIDLRQHPEFFQQITQNTQYIIHPDEIMADNFMFLVMTEKNPEMLEQFQPDGKGLLMKMKAFFQKDQ